MKRLLRRIRRWAAHGLVPGGLLVEQKAFEALGVSDWAYILVAGRVEIAGPATEILARPDIREVFLGASADAVDTAGPVPGSPAPPGHGSGSTAEAPPPPAAGGGAPG